MSLWKIAWRSIQQRSLASFLTGLSMALGVSLVVAVLVMSGVIGKSFQSSAGLGYNMIVGAKGGSLQLVLNTVYHLSRPVENIPYWYYKEFLPAAKRGDARDGKFAHAVDKVIPCLMGDYYGENRVVATNTAMFDDFQFAPGKKYEFAEGSNFKHNDFFAAVVGSQVARSAGIKLGDEIHPSHGAPDGHKHDPFKVVGILKRTGTPNDKAVFVNMEGFYLMGGHARKVAPPPDAAAPAARDGAQPNPLPLGEGRVRVQEAANQHPHPGPLPKGEGERHPGPFPKGEGGQEPLPENEREVTSLLVLTKSPMPGAPAELFVPGLIKDINKDFVAQAVAPIGEITRLFDTLVGPLTVLLLVLAVLIVVVSAIGIMVSIYNSMSERRHEIAVMRALGARRSRIMLIVLAESILLALAGGLCGWLLGHGLIALLSPWIDGQTGVQIGFGFLAPPVKIIDFAVPFVNNGARIVVATYPELLVVPSLIVLASLVGFIPAMSAYRTDVARSLTASL